MAFCAFYCELLHELNSFLFGLTKLKASIQVSLTLLKQERLECLLGLRRAFEELEILVTLSPKVQFFFGQTLSFNQLRSCLPNQVYKLSGFQPGSAKFQNNFNIFLLESELDYKDKYPFQMSRFDSCVEKQKNRLFIACVVSTLFQKIVARLHINWSSALL